MPGVKPATAWGYLGVGPANGSGDHPAFYGRPGEGLFFHRFHSPGPNGTLRNYYDVHSVDGTIARYREAGTASGVKHWNIEYSLDAYDNRTTYTYDSQGRMSRIKHPSGVDQVWNYSPSWIGTDPGDWDNSLYSGVEVTWEDMGANPADLSSRTTYLLFIRRRTSAGLVSGARPFAGDLLYRVYQSRYDVLDEVPAGAIQLYSLPGSDQEEYVVTQMTYHVNTPRVHEISHLVADSVAFGGPETTPVVSRRFTYEEGPVGSKRYRVKTDEFPLVGNKDVYTYTLDSSEPTRLDVVQRDEYVGTQVILTETATLDDFQRPTTVVLTPVNNPTNRPRASDPDGVGLAEPLSVTTTYQYSSCASCAGKPTVVEQQPSGRRWEYDYDNLTGLMTEERVPNPGGTGFAVTEYLWEAVDVTKPYSAYRLKSRTEPNGAVFDYTYVGVVRAEPSHGQKHSIVSVASPGITLANGTTGPAIVESAAYDVTHPLITGDRQSVFVGQLIGSLDGDGVQTEYQYGAHGYLFKVIENPSGGAARVETTFVRNRVALPTQVTINSSSSAPQSFTLTYNSADMLTKRSATVGTQVVEERFYYDQWGHLAVALRKNANSTNGAPDDFGTPARPDGARGWVRHEWQYSGDQLVREYQDRRSLDRDEDGADPLADALDARFLLTDYLWDPRGRLVGIGLPSGAFQEITYDGYGVPYKRVVSGGTSPVQERWFVNAAFDVVKSIQGTGSEQLVTLIERNASGNIEAVTEPAAPSVPGWYPWPTVAGRYEFDSDSLGNIVEQRVLSGGAAVAKTTFTYDQVGRPYRLDRYDPPSAAGPAQTMNVLWEGASKKKRVTDPAGRFVESVFDGLGRITERVDSRPGNPNKVTYGYKANTYLLERVTQSAWDEHPSTNGYVDRITEYRYDSLGRRTEILVGAPGSQIRHQFSYYATGDTETYTDPTGKQHKYLPDAPGRLVEHFMPGAQPIWNGTSYLDYVDGFGRAEEHRWDGRGRLTKTIFDFAGRPLAIMDPGASTEPTASSPHQAFSRFFEYDTASRVSKVFQGDGILVNYYRDGAGRLLARSTPTPMLGSAVVSWFHGRDLHRFDGLGRVVESAHLFGPDGAGGIYAQEIMEYDGLGRRTRESYKYLWGGNWVDVESSYTGADPLRTGLTYDNNLSGDADDLWLDFTPDAVGRLANLKWRTTSAGAPEMLGEYLHEGAPIRHRTTHWGTGSGQSFTTDYRYDAWGRMDKIEQSFSAAATVEFIYDDSTAQGSPYKATASNLVKELYEKQAATTQKGDRFAYDEHHRLAKAWLGSDQAHLNAGDPEASVGTWVSKLTYGLDAANNRTAVTSQAGPGGTPSTDAYSTQDTGEPGGESNRYDEVGNVTPTYDQRGNTTFDGLFYYVYDEQNRLTEVYIMLYGDESPGTMSATSTTSSEQRLASRASRARRYELMNPSAVETARNRILTRLPGGPIDLLARSRFPEVAATLREPLPRMAVRRMASSQPSTQSSTSSALSGEGDTTYLKLVSVYLYDSGNRRVARIVSDVQNWFYAWDGWSEAQEMVLGLDGENLVVRPQRQFAWGEHLDELVAYRFKAPGGSWAEYFVAEGGAHCPSRLLNEQGQVVEVQEYDPYGATAFHVGGVPALASAVGNPFGWKAVRIDLETGLLYMRNRYYSAKWGRFLTQDPLGTWGDGNSGGNGYVYARCTPLVADDAMGLQLTMRAGHDGEDVQLDLLRGGAYVGGAYIEADRIRPRWLPPNRSYHPALAENALGDLNTGGLAGWARENYWRQLRSDEFDSNRNEQLGIVFYGVVGSVGISVAAAAVSPEVIAYAAVMQMIYGAGQIHGFVLGELGEADAMMGVANVTAGASGLYMMAPCGPQRAPGLSGSPKEVSAMLKTDGAARGTGRYLAGKAPSHTTPGTRVLEGQYVDDLGRVQPWQAHYDEYGRLIGRTDFNAGNAAHGIPDTHHHTWEYSAEFPLGREVQSHVPGLFPGGGR